MANEQELQLEPVVEGGKSKKKLIIIIVVALLVVGIAVGATLFLLSGSDETEEDAEGDAAAEGEGEAATAVPANAPAIYVKMKPEFIVNYQVGTRQRYLQVYMEAMTRNPAIADALNTHSPMIRSAIIRIMGEQNFETLRTPEGRVNLKNLVTEEVRRLVTQETGIQDGLEQILFTNFVMQ